MAFSRSFYSFAPAVSRQRALPSWSAVKRLRRAAPQPCSTPRLARMCSHAGPQSDMAAEMLNFINYSWTPFHAVEEASRRLTASGFQHLKENTEWHLKPGSKYFFTRNMSTIVAFAVGKKYEPGNAFYMVGAHTDSPCLKVKPVSRGKKSDFLMLNVECYGGGLWATWFDRDLSVAGRVLIRDAADGRLYHRLVKVARPIMRIPMLAIHLNRDIGTAGFNPSKQTHVVPVLATAVKAALEHSPAGPHSNASARPNGGSSTPRAGTEEAGERHHPLLLRMLAEELGCEAGEIEDLELNVCDTQAGVVAGAANEFVYVGRLDNLAMSYCALQALLDACRDDGSLDEETGVRAVALFDHEEVGSASAQGAGGPVMRDTISRVSRCMAEGSRDAVERALRSSFLVSADMAHALHPNYPEKHDGEHAPQFHKGLVLKHNGNQRYATNAVSAALFREVGRRAGVPYQEFCVRNDMPCGSTIGPILSSNLGCRTLDVGMPQLSMHSIREMCGTDDVYYSYKHFLEFFQAFSVIDGMLDMDSAPPANVLGTISEQACNHVH